jgi:hypothetical protein
MSLVADFKHDLFVSYAHFDNEEDAQGVRWVSRFQLDLKNALRQRLGEDPEIFFDSRSFEASDHVDFLLDNARQSAVFVALFSPSYVAREFTIRELEAFCSDGSARPVAVVELLPVEEYRHPPLLQGRKRTSFWWRDRTEQDIPLRLTPKFNPELYNERLQILAHQLKKLLTERRTVSGASGADAPRPQTAVAAAPAAPAAPVAAKAGAVLLAQTTDDLYDECERVRAHLEQFGLQVLPEGDYPQGGAEFADAFAADLQRSGVFVQLLGTFGSRKPPDLPQTYAQYQYETARARGLKILQWRRPDLVLDAVTHRDRSLLEGPEVIAVGLEEFKKEIMRICAQPEAKPEASVLDGHCHVFINADRSDKELADTLLKAFEEKKNCSAARPLFEGSAEDIVKDLEENLLNCGALLLLYGRAPPAWVRAQLLRYSKLESRREAPPRLKSIVVGPPEPKAELGWSIGSFGRLDCLDGEVVRRIQDVIAGLQL